MKNTILLIEDNPGDARLVRELLIESNAGFGLHHLDRLTPALELISQNTFSLVLLDLLLPDGQGIDNFTRVKAKAPDTPIIILTGFDDQELGIDAVRHGAEDYLFKALLTPPLLKRSIQYALERHEIKQKLDSLSKELQSANKYLETLAYIDPQTSLLNRRGLEAVFEREVSLARRGEYDLSVLFVRLCGPSQDGPTDPDLKIAGGKIRGVLRAGDAIGMSSSAELAILLPHTKRGEAVRVADKIHSALTTSAHINCGTKETNTNFDIRLLEPGAWTSIEELSLSTEQWPLFKKNYVSVSSRNSKKAEYKGGSVANSGNLEVSYRAIHRLFDHSVYGYELVNAERAQSAYPEAGMEWVKSVLSKELNFEEGKRVFLSVPPETLITFKTELLNLFSHHSKTPDFCIEISDKEIVGNPADLKPAIDSLRSHGLWLAVREAGLGRSSLEALIVLSPDIICVTPSSFFNSRNILKRLISTARSTDAIILFDNIRRADDLSVIDLDIASDLAQGDFFSPSRSI